MTLSRFARSSTGKNLLITAAVVVVIAGIVALTLQSAGQPRTTKDGIPLPFATGGSGLQGAITLLMNRNGVDIYKVTFAEDETDEDLSPVPGVFLIRVPAGADRIHLDAAFTMLPHDDFTTLYPHDVNYYGYKYSSADAAQEIANMNDTSFTRRFPGQFFASATARAVDPSHGNFLATFASEKGITFKPTAKEVANRVELDANAFYLIVVNDVYPTFTNDGPVNFRIKDIPACGNTIRQTPEACDDGNLDNTDNCNDDCTANAPLPFDAFGGGGEDDLCGNGDIDEGEECDDENSVNTDGCTNQCMFPS